MTKHTGIVLKGDDVDDYAKKISDYFSLWNQQRTTALGKAQEARNYLYATDVISAMQSASMPWKNTTHIPHLSQLSENLQNQYWEILYSDPKFLRFSGATPDDRKKSSLIDKWLLQKLEQKQFRDTTARKLLVEYVLYGNCFLEVEYVSEVDDNKQEIYKGPVFSPVSCLDIVFDCTAKDFASTPKITRKLMHIADVEDLALNHPSNTYDQAAINKLKATRNPSNAKVWTDSIKDMNITYDGYRNPEQIMQSEMVELLTYRGSIYNCETGEMQRNRIITVADRWFVIRNEPNTAPIGFDGIHHAGWKPRPDNLWAQGPLEQLVGMQYRIDRLENARADIFDQNIIPKMLITGQVDEPDDPNAPGATWRALDNASSVQILHPDNTVLQADTQIPFYMRKMEDVVGALPLQQGIRTPGEKTLGEVQTLETNAQKISQGKVSLLEVMLSKAFDEAYQRMVGRDFDIVDYMEIFNDLKQASVVEAISTSELKAKGRITCMGSRHWAQRQKLIAAAQGILGTFFQDPRVRNHFSGKAMADVLAGELNWEELGIVGEYIGVKEDVEAQAMQAAEADKLKQQMGATQQAAPPPGMPVMGDPNVVQGQ